jgi:hypothetical protein
MLLCYLAHLTTGRLILWCYFIWYAVILVRYFDSSLKLWLTSLGISFIVGIALVISTTSAGHGTMKLDRWQIFRLFLMPLCVSSFSALVKGQGFILIFSPHLEENGIAAGLCLLLCITVLLLKRAGRAHASARS